MKLKSFFRDDFILLDLDIDNFDDILNFVASKFSSYTKLNEELILNSLKQRENLGSTYLDKNTAYPHARIDNFDDQLIMFIRTKKMIKLPKQQSGVIPEANCFFSVISSSSNAELYIRTLSAIAQAISNYSVKLNNSQSIDEILKVFSEINVKTKHSITAGDLLDKCHFARKNDILSDIIDLMSVNSIQTVPILEDKSDHIIGHITFNSILRSSLPEYALRIKSLSFSNNFEPLNEIWSKEKNVKAYEIMEKCEEFIVDMKTKYYELILIMAKKNIQTLYVTDEYGCLSGKVSAIEILHKLLRM